MIHIIVNLLTTDITCSCLLAADASISLNGSGSIFNLLDLEIFVTSAKVPVDAIWGIPGDSGVQQRDKASGCIIKQLY